MTKHNKLRYQVKAKPEKNLFSTGVVFLEYVDDDDELAKAKLGDMLAHAACEALHSTRFAEYESTGFSGYFKFDIFDGKTWQPVILDELFSEREHHFRKSECPMDTFLLCKEMLEAKKGTKFRRKYREHYEVADA